MTSFVRGALAVSIAAAALSGCKTPTPPPPEAAAPVSTAWSTISPGGDTMCATGTPFRFHVREGDPDRVMIFLNGGGACWSGDLCDLGTQPTPYTPFAEMDSNNPELLEGAFDLSNPENPFTGWTQVFVPYCTGDSHLGGGDVDYETSAGETITVHHRGKANVQAALDWVYENRPAPARIFVSGGSAGAIATPYYSGLVAQHYPNTEIAALADGAGGYRSPAIPGVLLSWGAFMGVPDWVEFATLDLANASVEDFFRVTAARFPQVQLARFDNVDDEVQQDFLTLLGTAKPVRGLLAANNADLARDIPSIRTFEAPGDDHTALRFSRFYTEEAGGVKLSAWVRDLAEGRPVESVSCQAGNTCD